jgi:glycerol-1-phosphate dehydrogenase [NAD(P)+]
MNIIDIPCRILIKNGAINYVNEFCKDLKNPLIIADPITYKIAGKIVAKKLGAQAEIVDDIKKFAISKIPGFIVAIGGGKIIDLGKLTAFKARIPFISIPTAPSHDGIFSPTVSLKELGIQSLKTKPAFGVIADLNILAKAPKRMIAAGAADIIAKYTSVWDWKAAAKRKKEKYSDFIANLALLAFEIVRKNVLSIKKREKDGIKSLIEAFFISGVAMCLAGSSRPASGSEHAFAHALNNLTTIMHGEAVGIGTIISAYLQKQDWHLVRKLLMQVGAPVKASQLGLDKDVILDALLKAKDIRPRWTVLNEINLNRKKAEKICLKTGIFSDF